MNDDPACDKKQKRKAIIYGTLVALICAVSGGVLISIGEATIGYGCTMFLVLPAACGFVTVFTVPFGKAVGISISIAMILCLAGLVFTGIEGIICVAMALPVLLTSALIGAAVGLAIKPRRHRNTSMAVIPLLAGATVFGAGQLESRLDTEARSEVVRSTIVIDAPLDRVWNAMSEFDEVTGSKPLLLRMGLPIPESCTMTETGVGAERVCHFNSGFIRERVTRWDPPYHLDFKVEEVSLPGRHWLSFTEASYTLERTESGHTKVLRTTTLTSILKPAFYWRFFERLGTDAEHRYILRSLELKCAPQK